MYSWLEIRKTTHKKLKTVEWRCYSRRVAGVSSCSARQGDWAENWEQYQRSPESSTGSLLCLIELNLLILENKLKICYSLQAFTRVVQSKETIAVWHQIQGPQIFFFLPFLNTSGLWCHLLQQHHCSVYSRVLKSNKARGSGFFWDVCCSRHQSEAEHSTILAEELGINISFFCFKAHNSLFPKQPLSFSALILFSTNLLLLQRLITGESN